MAFVDSITLGDLNIIQVDADPAVSGVTADIGSFAVLGDGSGAQIYQKFGAGDLDWKRITDDAFLKSQSPNRVIFVDKKGNDLSGDGSVFFPYLTVERAITAAIAANPLITDSVKIKIGTGLFAENNPLTIPENVVIEGNGIRNTSIVPNDQNSDLFVATNDFSLSKLNLGFLFTDPTVFCLNISGSVNRGVIIDECSFFTAINGINITSTDNEFKIFIDNVAFVDLSGVCINNTGQSNTTINNSRIIGNGTTTIGVRTADTAKTKLNAGTLRLCNIGFFQESSEESFIVSTDLNENNVPWQKLNASKINFRGASFVGSNTIVGEVEGVEGYALDSVQGENKLRVFDELSVGLPGKGKESVFGEGDSYTNGMLVYTFNGSTFTDVTEEASSTQGSSFTFPNTSINSAIYVSTQRNIKLTSDPVKWFGIKQSCLTALVGGEIVAEYWNGSSWVEFNHLSTDSGGQYFPYAKQIFQRTGNEQIRFDDRIDNDWALNDPVSFGRDLYWVRFRIESSLSVAPIFEQFKVHSNRTEINDDGYVEYFGKARPFAALPFDTATFQAANDSPSNADVYFGDNLAAGRIENQFDQANTDRSGFVIPFPEDLDTSCPVVATFYWSRVDGSDTFPDYDFTLRWSNSIDGDTVGDTTATVPTIAPRQQTLTQTFDASSVSDNEQFSITFELDVSEVITRRGNGDAPDLFWCTIQRDNDGNFSNIALIQCAFRYTKRTNGGHL